MRLCLASGNILFNDTEILTISYGAIQSKPQILTIDFTQYFLKKDKESSLVILRLRAWSWSKKAT